MSHNPSRSKNSPVQSDGHDLNQESTDITPKEQEPKDAQNTLQSPPYTVFGKHQRRVIVTLCSLAGFFSPFSALAYFPAIEYMSEDLHVSLQLMNLTITMFLVIQGIAPAIIGDLADQIGRRPVYLGVLVLYFVSCVALALQRSYPALLVLRMIQSAGSSATCPLRNTGKWL